MSHITLKRLLPPFQEANRQHLIQMTVGACIGILTFLIVCGPAVLNPAKDAWILFGYDEWDIVQSHAGWLNFYNSPWSFPLANATAMGYPAINGVNISFSDSLPLVSIVLKLFSPFLPESFQFLGIYTLLCFALQGVAAQLLLSLFHDNIIFNSLGTIFFTTSPIMMERAFRHTALASHYIILFVIYLYFKNRKAGYRKLPWAGGIVLSILSIGITPYFLPMVAMFLLLLALEYALHNHTIVKSAAFFLACVASSLGTAYILGSVGHGYNSSRNGYGYYSMNLNAPINPRSMGGYSWSRILQERPQLHGQYDGFNYLGAGILLLVVFILVVGCALLLDRKNTRLILKHMLKRNIWLVLACLFMTAFAVSNVVCFDNHDIVIPVWDKILNLCGIFRASSRIFYPVFYCIYLFAIVSCGHLCRMIQPLPMQRIASIVLLFFFTMLQLYDFSLFFRQRHDRLDFLTQTEPNLPVQLLQLQDYEVLLDVDNRGGTRYPLYIAGKNQLLTNCIDTNTSSATFQTRQGFVDEQLAKLQTNNISDSMVYTTINIETFKSWQQKFSDKAEFVTWHEDKATYWMNDIYFMIPKIE